jgi:hypothetical protein
MQETERVVDGLVERLGIRKSLGGHGIEKLVEQRELQNVHGAFLKGLLDQSGRGYLASIDPDIAFCCVEDCERPFCAVLWRQEQGL